MSLIIENLSKRFGQEIICQNFNLKMEPGQVSLLVGQSGSGKTTILRMVNHLEEADQGSIQIGDTYLVKDGNYQKKKLRAQYQKKVGLVFQDYQLFPNLNVMDNLLLAPLDNGLGSLEDLTLKAQKWLNRFGLGEKVNTFPSSLSGGQKQRVALIRSLMMEPDLLCFDEPTAALDLANTQDFAKMIIQLQDEGKMILIVTHDSDLLTALGTEVQVVEAKDFISQKTER